MPATDHPARPTPAAAPAFCLLLVAALAATPRWSTAQPHPGEAPLVVRAASGSTALWSVDTVRGGIAPADVTALGQARIHHLHLQRATGPLLLAVRFANRGEDVLVAASWTDRRVHGVIPFADGLRGRVVGMQRTPDGSLLLVATEEGVFAVPDAGGQARPLTPALLPMANHDLVVPDADTLVTTAAGAAAWGVWVVRSLGTTPGFVPLRVPGPLALADGSTRGSFVLGDAGGNLHRVDAASLSLTPVGNVGEAVERLQRMSDYPGLLVATRTRLLLLTDDGSRIVARLPLTAAGIDALTYRPFEPSVSTFGAGCPGSNGAPAVSVRGNPIPGNATFALLLGNVPGSTVAALLLGTVRIDVPLDPFGMRGCRLLVQPIAAPTVVTRPLGPTTVPLPVPPDPGLAGAGVLAQWAVVDPRANAGGLITSQGLLLTF